jgi:translation initiation factor 6
MRGMRAAKYVIRGSDCVGAFATATDNYVFAGSDLTKGNKDTLSEVLKARCIELSIADSNLIGIFARANSNGMLISNLATDREFAYIKKLDLDMEIRVLESPLNAIGNNIMANDRMAMANPEYDKKALQAIRDTLGVEVVKGAIGGFKTIGANNILTNKGIVVNNYCTEKEKDTIDKWAGAKSVRATANTGSLGIGISVVANSHGIVVGDSTTGFELARILEGLNIEGD